MTPVRYDLRREEIVFGAKRMRVTAGPAWLLCELAAARGRHVRVDELIWRRWGGEDEPEYAYACLNRWVMLTRRLLDGSGLSIENRWGYGYRLVVGRAGLEPAT